jgi:ATP-dependent protease HslVU (ClpYQ) peptidase subunit
MLAIHGELRDHHGLRVVEDAENDAYESSQFQALIANRYGLWKMLSCREIIPIETFAAIGSGREFAIGAVEALGIQNPESTLRRSISIASAYDLATGGEIRLWQSHKFQS